MPDDKKFGFLARWFTRVDVSEMPRRFDDVPAPDVRYHPALFAVFVVREPRDDEGAH